MQPTDFPMSQSQELEELWVLEGTLDFPIALAPTFTIAETNKEVQGLSLDFSGRSGDGFMELRATDVERANNSGWWSPKLPVAFDFRCSIVGRSEIAWQRANDFLQQMLDRLSFVSSMPTNVISYSRFYNEADLLACVTGEKNSYRIMHSGDFVRTTHPIYNFHLLQFGNYTNRAKLATAWYRKALTFLSEEDQFLAFFVAIEVVSDDIQSPTAVTPRCQKCDAELQSFTSHLEGLKELIKRHSELPQGIFKVLRGIRARIAHGNLSVKLKDEVRYYLPLIRQLAAEGIAVSIGADPKTMKTQPDLGVFDLIVLGTCIFDQTNNPHVRWGRSIREALDSMPGNSEDQ